jgi:hypothetical protein
MEQTGHTWRNWYGGETRSDSPPLIGGLILQLRRKVGGLKARRQANGPAFAIKSAKDLMDKIRAGADELGLLIYVAGQDGGNIDAERGTMAWVKALVRVAAPDGSFVDLIGCGHGADRDDKAAGKASTYAWKDALIKGLCLPDAELVDTDDESGVPTKARRGGRTKVEGAEASVPYDPLVARCLAALEAVTSGEELDALVAGWRPGGANQLPPDAAVVVGPLAGRRRRELLGGK